MTPPAPPHCSTTIISLQKNGERGRKKIIMFEIPRVASASSGPHVMRSCKKTLLNLDACVVTFLTPSFLFLVVSERTYYLNISLFSVWGTVWRPRLQRKYLGRRDKGEGADIFRLLRWVSAIPLLPSPSPSAQDELSDIGRRRRRRKERKQSVRHISGDGRRSKDSGHFYKESRIRFNTS